MTESKYKVGDELEIQNNGWGRTWSIFKITKISPTGRITLGNGSYILDASLKVRGRNSYSGPYRAHEITKEIRDAVRKDDLLYAIKNNNDFTKLSLRQLEAIVVIIKGEATDDT